MKKEKQIEKIINGGDLILTADQQDKLRSYKMSSYTNLRECYCSYSWEKEQAYREILTEKVATENSFGVKIPTYSRFYFSMAYCYQKQINNYLFTFLVYHTKSKRDEFVINYEVLGV